MKGLKSQPSAMDPAIHYYGIDTDQRTDAQQGLVPLDQREKREEEGEGGGGGEGGHGQGRG